MSRPIPPHVARRRRDLTAVMLIVAGLAGVVVVAFAAAPLLGWAALSVEAVGVGLVLAAAR